jgi:hypothetical protein
MLRIDWIISFLGCLAGGWMIFDGIFALNTGTFVTRKTGDYAGQLGIWSKVVSLIGIDPRSTTMMLIFLLFGSAWFSVSVLYAIGIGWSRSALLVTAIAMLWFLPFGTMIAVLQIVLLLVLGSKT